MTAPTCFFGNLRKDEQAAKREIKMKIQKGSVVIGSDGVLAGTVGQVDGDNIQLVEQASEPNKRRGPHRYIPLMFVAKIEDGKVCSCRPRQLRR